MTTLPISRRSALHACATLAAAMAFGGCAAQTAAPTTQPTTQPDTEQRAYDTAEAVYVAVDQLATIAMPLIPPPYNAYVTEGLAAANLALNTWRNSMGQGVAAELQAQVTAALTEVMTYVAQAKAKAAGTTPVDAANKARLRLKSVRR